MRVLFCGSRNFSNGEIIRQVMLQVKPTVVIQGEARGADSIARNIAQSMGIPVESYPAKWDEEGKAAGSIRNIRMLKEGKPDCVIAFSDDFANSKGTKHMVKIALEAGIPFRLFTSEGEAFI